MDIDLSGPIWNSDVPLPPENASFGIYRTSIQIAATNCSYIYLGSSENDHSKKAIKFIKRTENSLKRIENEVYTMTLAHHPNILKIDEFFTYEHYICLVTPYAAVGSLHRLVQTQYRNGLPELTAKIMMRQMLEALNYLHGINIWHRDIKPDNFLVFDPSPNNPIIFLSDFGFARIFEGFEKSEEYVGTPEFAPPEMFLRTPYDNSVDIWSLGITLYVMLSGRYPFPNIKTYTNDFLYKLKKGMLNYNLLKRLEVSPDAIDLIQKMCQVDPSDRITPIDALRHPWVASTFKESNIESDIAGAIFGADVEFDLGM